MSQRIPKEVSRRRDKLRALLYVDYIAKPSNERWYEEKKEKDKIKKRKV